MAGISSLVFMVRNGKKAVKGDVGRYGVVAAQAVNVTNAAAESSIGFVSDGAKKVLADVDNVGLNVFNSAGVSTKIAKFASKAVNPLLVGAAGIRVLKDEDKKSRAIEEAAALSSMFLGEKAYKLVRNTISKDLGKTLKEGQKVIKNKAIADKLGVVAKKLGEWTKNSTGKQKALFILAEIGFVLASVKCFDLGKKIGTKITGRDKKPGQTPKQNVEQVQNAAVQEQGTETPQKFETLA